MYYKHALLITVYKSGEAQFSIPFLLMLHRRFAKQHEFHCVNLIGRGWRTWKNEPTNTHIPYFQIRMKRPQPLRGEFKTLLVPWTEPSSAANMAGSYFTGSRCKPSVPFSGYSFKRPLLASFSISTTSCIVGLISGALCAHSAATYQDSS